MLETIREAIARRKQTPVEAARQAHDERCADLKRVEATQAENVARVKAAFDADPTDATADALALAERRADLLTQHVRDQVAAAETVLAAAERDELTARIAELDAIADGVSKRVLAL